MSTGTVRLRAQFDNAGGKLFPNQFVNVKMVVDVLHNVVTVPSAAVQRSTQGTIVYVVNEDSTVSVRPVKLGASEGDTTAIDSGIKPGERVITDGVDRIREGAKVDVIVPGAPARAGGDASKRTPEQREAFKKKMESMTPEQREAFKKQREAAKNGFVNPSRIFILRPVATALLMVAILLAGIVAYRQLPSRRYPRWTTRPFKSSRSTRVPVPTSSPRPSPPRSSGSSARCQA